MDSSTPPRIHPVDPLVALATEVRALGRRLDRIGAALLALRAGEDAQPTTTAPDRPAASGDPEVPRVPGGAPSPLAGGAAATGQPGWGPGWWHPPTTGAGATPGWDRPRRTSGAPRSALSGARLLAWTGGAVTLVGVVMFVVLAAQRGWLPPEARIVAGGLLGVVLVGTGMWLHRRESARTGASATATTGFATLYLVVAGATFVVDLPTVPAVVLALLVAACGLGLADRWRSQLSAAGVVVGAAVLAPVLVGGTLLVALTLVLQVAAAPVVLRRRWPVLALVAAAGPVLYGTATNAITDTALTTLAVLLVGLGTAAAATRRLSARPVATLVAAAPLPVLAAVPALGRWDGAALAAGAGVALLAVAALPTARRVVARVAVTAAAVAIFQATAVLLDGSTRTAVLLGQAAVLAVLAAVVRSRLPLAVACGYGLVGVVAALVTDAPIAALIDPVSPYLVDGRPMTGALVVGAVVSALVLALAVALAVAAGRVGLVRPDAQSAWLWVPVGLVGLYGAAGLVITAAVLVTGDRIGFTAGHALVTVSWTVGALVLLARGISRQALRVTGLALVAAAVVKLVLFDLGALDGPAQVGAFLGAGLVILAAGTRYARLVTEAEKAEAGGSDAAAPGDREPPTGEPGPGGGSPSHTPSA